MQRPIIHLNIYNQPMISWVWATYEISLPKKENIDFILHVPYISYETMCWNYQWGFQISIEKIWSNEKFAAELL